MAASDIGQEMVGAVRGVLGLSRPGRLRDQLRELLDIHSKMDGDDLDVSRRHIAKAIEIQAQALAHAVDPDKKRKLSWGSFLVAVGCSVVPLAGITFWGSHYTDHWWGWVWVVMAGVTCVVLMAAAIAVLVGESDPNRA